MVTNFSHMANYKDIYSKLLWIENQLVNGYIEAVCETEEEYIMRVECCRAVIGMARTALEMMIDELFRVGQITDAKVEEILQKVSPNEQNHHSNLFGKIRLMEEYELVPNGMIKDMHFIRMVGNQELHATQAREQYINAKENAIKVYEALYRISYLFAKQYVAEFIQLGKEVDLERKNAGNGHPTYASEVPQSYAGRTQIHSMEMHSDERTKKENKRREWKVALILLVSLIIGMLFTGFLLDCCGTAIFELPLMAFLILFLAVWMIITTVIFGILSPLLRR